MRYKITLNNKKTLIVDEYDYQKITSNVDQAFVTTKAGVISPAYIMLIEKDEEAIREEIRNEQNKKTMEHVSKPIMATIDDIRSHRPDFIKEALEK